MTFPTAATKTNCDSSSDDPKQALLVDLANLVDKFNQLLSAAAASGDISTSGITGTVNISGAQTVGGLKSFTGTGCNFTNSLGVPAATASGHAVRLDQVFGNGASWTNLTSGGTRALNTVYTNTTGKTIAVAVSGSSPSGPSGALLTGEVGGVSIGSAYTQTASGTVRVWLLLIVPAGATFVVYPTYSTVLNSWAELS